MTNELKDRIKNFISSWDNTIEEKLKILTASLNKDDDFIGLADYDSFLQTAISLLEETIGEK